MGEKRGKGEGDGAVLWLPTQWAAQTAVNESKNLCSIQALFCQKSLSVSLCISLSLSVYLCLSLSLSLSLRQTDRKTDRDRQIQTETDRYRQRDRETEREADTYRNSSPPGTVSLLERKEEKKEFGCGTSLSKEFC